MVSLGRDPLQGEKLDNRRLWMDNCHLDAMEALVVGDQSSQASHVICVEMGQKHIDMGDGV